MPLINDSEVARLADIANGIGQIVYVIEEAADHIIERRPSIRDLIKLDESCYLDELESHQAICYAERADITLSLVDGYEFLIGCMTYVGYWRSGEPDFRSFMDGLPNTSPLIPIRKHAQQRRLSECVTEETTRGIADELALSPRRHAEKTLGYIIGNAPSFGNLINENAEQIKQGALKIDDSVAAYVVDAFYRGVYGAVMLYSESFSQAYLDQIGVRFPVSKAEFMRDK